METDGIDPDKNLTLLTIDPDEDMFLNRLDSIIEYVSQFETDDSDDYFVTPLMHRLIESRMFYLAWIEEGY